MLPEQFLTRMQAMLGEEYNQFLESFSRERYQALRINTLKERENQEPVTYPFSLSKVSWSENGYYYEKEDAPGKHPYHEAGAYYIQEPSAMAPVTLLAPKPGEQVLDLCAAPGGKSTQIAALMKGEGLLVSNEIHPARAKILSENIERMGIRNACVTNESPQRLVQFFPEYFDRILVDAPCSGEGMFRKNEAACEEWSPENVRMCGERQDEILECAAKMLRPGGRLVYSTCTFAPTENEESIDRFLRKHGEFSIAPIQKEEFGLEEADVGPEGTLRLWPHHVKGEGHYAAVLVKAGEMPQGYHASAQQGLQKGVSEKELGEYSDFAKEFLRISLEGKYVKFGDNIYLVPENMPDLKGLKVLRPGLHVGTLKKNRFEPAHAMALALASEDVKYSHDLKSTENTIAAYLNGQTFPAEGEKGWYLICVDGFSIGWGKLAGGIMKNHYPKGLRKN